MFFQSAARPDSRRILEDLWQQRAKFDDDFITFFGVSTDPLDQQQARVREHIPGMRYFWDFDLEVSRMYGAVRTDAASGTQNYTCHTVLLDTRLRTLAVITMPGTNIAPPSVADV